MSGLLVITWIRFFGWLAIGMVIYWLYSQDSEFAARTFNCMTQNRSSRRCPSGANLHLEGKRRSVDRGRTQPPLQHAVAHGK